MTNDTRHGLTTHDTRHRLIRRHSCAGDFASLNTLNLGGSSSDNGLDMNGEPKLNGMILGVAEMAQMDIDLELMRKDR